MTQVGSTAGLIFGFLMATIYGSGFHVIIGGPARRIILYLFSGWIGFAIGHFLGDFLEISLLQLGAIHLFTASLGSWAALILSWLFVKQENRLQQ